MSKNSFVKSVVQNQVYGQTGNGALTYNTTSSPVLDYFNAAGNRNVDLSKEFDLAYSKDKKLAIRVSLWMRDIRGGAGERQSFRNVLKHMERHYKQDLIKLISYIPEFGRWDDILIFSDKDVKKASYTAIKDAIDKKNGLVGKWLPRKGQVANELSEFLGLGLQEVDKKLPKKDGGLVVGKTKAASRKYRQLLKKLSTVVESQMCAKEWDAIEFDKVPSLASARYQKAFNKHCGVKYQDYRTGLTKIDPNTGKTERKINAGAVYPYDVIKSVHKGDRIVAQAQWDALPNFLGDNSILPMIDVSGSMYGWSSYGKRKVQTSVTPIDVAVSIGMYTASKQSGDFKGMFSTFSENPTLQRLSGSVVDMYNQILKSHWGFSTDLIKAFNSILALAKKNKIKKEDMPKIMLIVSDMEFNASCPGVTTYDVIRSEYQRSGYDLPQVVFWNINGRSDNNPVQFDQLGTALVSGFSPAIFKSILSSNLSSFTPENVMLDTLNNTRYDVPGLTV